MNASNVVDLSDLPLEPVIPMAIQPSPKLKQIGNNVFEILSTSSDSSVEAVLEKQQEISIEIKQTQHQSVSKKPVHSIIPVILPKKRNLTDGQESQKKSSKISPPADGVSNPLWEFKSSSSQPSSHLHQSSSVSSSG